MSVDDTSAGDALPASCFVIEVRVSELNCLFNSIDPSPFHTKDLDPSAAEFIVGWSKEAPHDAQLGLLVYLERAAGLPDEPAILREAVHEFFRQRALVARRRLRELFRVGRTSLLIGLAVLGSFVALGRLVAGWIGGGAGEIAREGLVIGGWVAMWRPLQIFLYDWWPIRSEARLFDRLAAMPVRIRYTGAATSEGWRRDWPTAQAAPVAS